MDITVQKNLGFLQSMLCLYTRPQYFKLEDSALIMDFVFTVELKWKSQQMQN